MQLPTPVPVPVPGITALFLVQFDNRQGYTLVWHRTRDPARE